MTKKTRNDIVKELKQISKKLLKLQDRFEGLNPQDELADLNEDLDNVLWIIEEENE